jgi:hypothetical protein
MVFILVSDWLWPALGRYGLVLYNPSARRALDQLLPVTGLREWLGVRAGWAWGLTALGTALTISLLAVFAR